MRKARSAVICTSWLISFNVFSQAAVRPAPDVQSSALLLDAIVVTARRRDEDLQAVPAAVSVVQGAWLDRSNTVNTQQLSQLVPSLYYNSANPRNTAYTIRGLGSNTLSVSAANDGIEPGVGYYVDGVYHGRPAAAAFDFTDIERVEVLRGPQGTLFGKNSSAGVIHIVSRQPTFQPEALGELSVGELNFRQMKGSVSGGLAENVAGRLSVQTTQRDGTLFNVASGQRQNELNNTAVRAQLLFTPTDALSVRLVADVSDLDSDCCTQSYLRVGQSRRSASRQFPALAAGLGYVPPSTNVYDRLTDIDSDLHIDTQDGGVSMHADWQFGGSTLNSITAWRYWDWSVANDRDYIGLPIQTVQGIPSRQDQYSQEFRFASDTDQALRHVFGAYFYTQKVNGEPTSIYGSQAAYWLLNPANFTVAIPRNLLDGYGQIGDSRFEMKSYALFGEANYDFTAATTGTVGLRYTYEDKAGSYATRVFGGPDLSAFPASTRAELTRARLSIFRPQSYRAKDEGGSLSGRVNLAHRFSDDVFGYASYAQGFKSGGLNMAGLPLDAANQPALATAVIEDERNTTAEVGLKTTWFQGRATLNLAGYRTVVEDYQANIVSSLETAAIRSYPANIPQVRVQGAEADFMARVAEGLTLRASVAYGDGRYTDYPNGPCPLEQQTSATVACNLTDKPLAGLSRWVGTLGIDYERPLRSGALLLHVDSSTRSGYNSDTSSSIYTRIGGYNVTNARVGYRFNQRWEAQIFAQNLFDSDYLTALTIQTGNSGLILGQPSDPRMVGLTVRAHFD